MTTNQGDEPNMARFIHSVAKRVTRLVVSIPSLEAVYVRARPWGFECWLVANQSTEEERFRLYDLEWDFMEQLPDLGFKFNLVDRERKPLSEVMSVEDFDAVTQRCPVHLEDPGCQ